MSAFNGHILGAKGLRKINARSGRNFERASRVTISGGTGREIVDGKCVHYRIDWNTAETSIITKPTHWSSCPQD